MSVDSVYIEGFVHPHYTYVFAATISDDLQETDSKGNLYCMLADEDYDWVALLIFELVDKKDGVYRRMGTMLSHGVEEKRKPI